MSQEDLTALHLRPDAPLYQQVYQHMRQAILSGRLKRGSKVSSTRALACALGVSRNTVREAFDMLHAEGYLVSSAGSGTFVSEVLPESFLQAPSKRRYPQPRKQDALEPRLADTARALLAEPVTFLPTPGASNLPYHLQAGLPALEHFPHGTWSALSVRHAKRSTVHLGWYQDAAGHPRLREAIAAHVTLNRQVRCTAEQVVIVSGTQGGLDLVSRLLISRGDSVWTEDPGYFGARGAFLGSGASLVPVPLDEQGLDVNWGIDHAPQARLAFVAPSHQFPLGVTMSLSRRLALLEWAKHSNAYIVEDDYDSEFRYAGRPLASLQGLDDHHRVIYLGTFSKVLAPSLRLGFVIFPPELVGPALSVRKFIDVHPPSFEQAVLADFIAEGHFSRHLRRMRTLYAERRAAFLDLCRDLPMALDAPNAGLHCIGWLPGEMSERALLQAARRYDLALMPLSWFKVRAPQRPGMVLGFGGYPFLALGEAVNRLRRAMLDLQA